MPQRSTYPSWEKRGQMKLKTKTARGRLDMRVKPHRLAHWSKHLKPNLSEGITAIVDDKTGYKEPKHDNR